MSQNQVHEYRFLSPRTETHPDPYRIYNEYGAQEDKNLVRECNESMDTMLVFSGLFSAVITAFVSISYRNLSEDPQDRTNVLLLAMLNATYGGGQFSPSDSEKSFVVPTWAIVVNVLFFCSLVLSLSAAMLVKQWARQYEPPLDALVGAVTWEKSRKRYQKRRGVDAWHLRSIISTLPMFIHLALLLFLTGACVWIQSLHTRALFLTVLILFLCAVATYLIIAIIPSIAPDAPFRWPASGGLEAIVRVTQSAFRSVFSFPHKKHTTEARLPEAIPLTPGPSLIRGYDYIVPIYNWREDAYVLLEVLRRSEHPQEHEAVMELLRTGRWNDQPSLQTLLYEHGAIILHRCNALASIFYSLRGLRPEYRDRCRSLLYFLEWYYYQMSPIQRRSLAEWPEEVVATRFYEQLITRLVVQPSDTLEIEATHLADISLACSVAVKLRHVRLVEGENCGRCLLQSKRPNARVDIADLWSRILEVDSDLRDSRDFLHYMRGLLVSCIWSDTDCLMNYTSFEGEEDLPGKIRTVLRTYFRCLEAVFDSPSEIANGLVTSLEKERTKLHQDDSRIQWLSNLIAKLQK